MKYKAILTLAICFYCIFPTSAQEFFSDLQEMRKTYENADAFQANVDVKMFENGKHTISKYAKIKKTGKNFFYELDNITFLLNEKYSVMVNNVSKVIVFGEQSEGSAELYESLHQFRIEEMDSLFRQNKEWKFKGISNAQKQYELFNQGAYINKTELFINASNYTIKKVVFHYNEEISNSNSKVVITYNASQINPTFSNSTFSETKYIQKQNGKWITSPSFRNYELIEIPNEG